MKGNAIITAEGLDLFNHALGLLDKSINHLKKFEKSLVPEILKTSGLRQAITDICIASRTNFASSGGDIRYDEKLEIAAWWITAELIINAKMHPDATKTEVQLVCEPDRISITVLDNGRGIDNIGKQNQERGGLAKIRELVSSFEGQFDVSSENGKGTEASVEFKIRS